MRGNLRIYCRIKPDLESIISSHDNKLIKQGKNIFNFDRVFNENS
jgi:hypothetical protein